LCSKNRVTVAQFDETDFKKNRDRFGQHLVGMAWLDKRATPAPTSFIRWSQPHERISSDRRGSRHDRHQSTDALVGAVVLEYILLKLKPQMEDDADFRGAFHVLSGFSAEQLAGFSDASVAAGSRASRLSIQFPEFELRPYAVDAQYTTSDSSVNVRNRERTGSVTLTAKVEADAEASLADSDRTDASGSEGQEYRRYLG
jgi:hypothetical protein